jgi:ATP-binding cassette, subfamily B, bacterial MsbA
VAAKPLHFLAEYLRINAIRRMLTIVDVRRSEIAGLIAFAVVFAVFEGIGISLLLPILEYAEGGQASVLQSSGPIWVMLDRFMDAFNLPVTLPVLLAMAFIPILLRQIVFYFNTWYSAVVSSRIAIRMRMQTLDTVLDADPEFFARHAVGRLVNVLIAQTSSAGQAILGVIRQLSIAILMALYVAILLAISVPLTLVTLAFAVLVSFLVRASIVKTRAFAVEAAAISQEMMGKIVERMGLMRLIKLRDQKRAESERIRGFSETMRVIGVKQARLGARIEVTADPLLMLSVFITLYIGIAVLGMTLAQLGLVLFVLTRLNAKVKEFNAGRQAISQNVAGLLLVQQTTEEAIRSNRITSGPLPFEGLTREIVLSDVTFDYPDSYTAEGKMMSAGKEVLKGISATIPAGSFTALVGRSGAGKSTLVELLPRLREATGGTITYDGTDIREFQVGSLRKGIGYLTQSAMLFNDTVRENLIYGLDFEPSEEQIRAALEQAYATFVYDLPNGLETHLGDRGVRFSGGERQRIGLARVLLADTSVLILDEPTSALDSESEAFIQKALADLHGTKTIIVIAHRLATVVKADQLLLIEDGTVVERGTHEELVAKGETYQKLFETQLLA